MNYILVLLLLVIIIIAAVSVIFRRVVPADSVHILQKRKTTISYGKETGNGNTYYQFPPWLPVLGVLVKQLPTSIFNINIRDYEAYDKGRVPFMLDVSAFFRIEDSKKAAERISDTETLNEQLGFIIKGAIRTTLSSFDIEQIMEERGALGAKFTEEVRAQLKEWGISVVKDLEIMDIRDGNSSKVISNIMDKKKSLVEMQSRTEVAKNIKEAEIAEILARQETEVKKQMSLKTVGLQEVETNKLISLSKEEAMQKVKDQEKITKEKEMSVLQVMEVQKAAIAKERETIFAETEKKKIELSSDAALYNKQKESEGIVKIGNAKAEAEKQFQLATVTNQITLAKEIGSNDGYQKYLITIEQVKAGKEVGIEQAKALEKAQIKIIANSGDAVAGVGTIGKVFNGNNASNINSFISNIMNNDDTQNLIGSFFKKNKPEQSKENS